MSKPATGKSRVDVRLNEEGGVRLPGALRRRLGIRPGAMFRARAISGRILLEPADLPPIELYSAGRTRGFDKAARMSPRELSRARRKWGL